MAIQFRNLVFEGGGVRGIAYVGAMQILEQRKILENIQRVGGTSVGAINALLVALGCSVSNQQKILESTDFKKFMDDSFGIIRDIRRLSKEFGWFKGAFFSDWAGDIIKRKLGNKKATFKDLQEAGCPGLYVIGTNLSTGFSEVFSGERHPDMPLVDALRISMSIPLFFTAIKRGNPQNVYVDGGVMLNYPVKLFDREKYIDMTNESYAARKTDYYNENNKVFALKEKRSPYVYNCQTLGLRLDKAEEIGLFRYDEPARDKPVENFTGYARALIGAIMGVQENFHLHSDDWHRTVYINTLKVRATDFNLSDATKKELLKQGIDGAKTYFEWFDNLKESPVNRIKT